MDPRIGKARTIRRVPRQDDRQRSGSLRVRHFVVSAGMEAGVPAVRMDLGKASHLQPPQVRASLAYRVSRHVIPAGMEFGIWHRHGRYDALTDPPDSI